MIVHTKHTVAKEELPLTQTLKILMYILQTKLLNDTSTCT